MKTLHRSTLASRRSTFSTRFALALALLVTTSAARAECIYLCNGDEVSWRKDSKTLGFSKNSFQPGPWRDGMEIAMARWNQSPADFRWSIHFNEVSVSRGNSDSETWFTDNQDIVEGKPAKALIWRACRTITEVDIVFNVDYALTTSMSTANSSAYGGSFRTFQTVAEHELGHGLGLCHVNYRYNVMGSDKTHVHANDGVLRAYAGEDAIDGAVNLYGLAGTYEDVGVSHWKYGSANGEYSTHVRTQIYSAGNNPLASSTIDGEPYYRVNKGQTIKVEFTYENLGRNPHNVDIDYVLSTNDRITTLDPLLATGSIPGMARNAPITTNNTTLVLPGNLESGKKYWIGAIVNPDKTFDEATSANNATYIGILVN